MKESKHTVRATNTKGPDDYLHPPTVPMFGDRSQVRCEKADDAQEPQCDTKMVDVYRLGALALGMAYGFVVGAILAHAGFFR